MFPQDDGDAVPLRVVKRRLAVEKWKAKNRDRYLEQKRTLAARPEYRAHRREMYRQHVEELTQLGVLPRPKGRPRLYEGEEAAEMRRESARRASARYREKSSRKKCELCGEFTHVCSEATRMCGDLAGYVDARTKQRTACLCRDMVRPLRTSLDARIVALAECASGERAVPCENHISE